MLRGQVGVLCAFLSLAVAAPLQPSDAAGGTGALNPNTATNPPLQPGVDVVQDLAKVNLTIASVPFPEKTLPLVVPSTSLSISGTNPVPATSAIAMATTAIKIYIYDDMPSQFNSDWTSGPHDITPELHEFEPEFTALIRSSSYYTNDITQATHFYMPVYPVSYCSSRGASHVEDMEGHCFPVTVRQFLTDAVSWVQQNHPLEWNRNTGRDHLLPISHDWAGCFKQPELGRVAAIENIRVVGFLGYTASRLPEEETCMRSQDITLPAFTVAAKRATWPPMANSPKSRNVYFRGSTDYNDARKHFLPAFNDFPNSQLANTRVSQEQYINDMGTSEFCLVPGGHAPWTYRLSEAILGGCIPVIPDNTHVVLPCAQMIDYSSFAILTADDPVPVIQQLHDHLDRKTDFIARAHENMDKYRDIFLFGQRTMDCFADQLRN